MYFQFVGVHHLLKKILDQQSIDAIYYNMYRWMSKSHILDIFEHSFSERERDCERSIRIKIMYIYIYIFANKNDKKKRKLMQEWEGVVKK